MNTEKTVCLLQTLLRILLGLSLLFAGLSHLTFARTEFLAQVPNWVPLDGDLVVVLSGIAEIVLGAALISSGATGSPWVGSPPLSLCWCFQAISRST